MNKECMNKTLLLRSLYTGPHHLSFLIHSSFFLGLLVLYICHERINGAITASFRLTFRVIEWQSWKGPYRWSPKLSLKSELLKKHLRQISVNSHLSEMQTTRTCKCLESYTFYAIVFSVRVAYTLCKGLCGIGNPFTYIISLKSHSIFLDS